MLTTWMSDGQYSPAACLIGSPVTVVQTSTRHPPSQFEDIISRHPPILESLLNQLPTSSILTLYHVSPYLKSFLSCYPIAWSHMSFRAMRPGRVVSRQTSPASDATGDLTTPQSKPFALDQLLVSVIVPFGTRLKSLDLDQTAVSGSALFSVVLPERREILEHLSVRGCKRVSLKYHIMPYLTLFSLQVFNWKPPPGVGGMGRVSRANRDHSALKSLYTFRCRHHRRRPYTPTSLSRQDSDAEPTHELIKICRKLGIWTDTTWCPTPAGRCLRRGEFSLGRSAPDARTEVWVVFDRLWRSDNRLGQGPSEGHHRHGEPVRLDGRLWEISEFGHDGEALAAPDRSEGKILPTHLRQSHTIFVDNVKCHICNAQIYERCEHCSVRMHCMGCRKTLCANCAFARPLPTSEGIKDNEEPFWWAPGQTRSPNLLMQEQLPTMNNMASFVPPPLKLQSCCMKPVFSNGGGVTFVGPGMTASVTSHLRTAPLPMGQGYEDPEFARIRRKPPVGTMKATLETACLCNLDKGPLQTLDWILRGPGNNDENPCPRNLCQECFSTSQWASVCVVCRERFCFAHDLRGLRMRVCGLKDLNVEKELAQRQEKREEFIAECLRLCETSEGGFKVADAVKLGKQEIIPQGSVSAFQKICETYHTWQDVLRRSSMVFFLEHVRILVTTSDESRGPLPLIDMLRWPKEISSELCNEIQKLLPLKQPRKGTSPGADEALDSTCPSSEQDSQSKHTSKLSGTKSPYLWQGCSKLMCPRWRSIGDSRPPCSPVIKQCTVCGVDVCPTCTTANLPCNCRYCEKHYMCPRCFPLLYHRCTKAAEEKVRKEKAIKQAMDTAIAEKSLEQAGEFLSMSFGELGQA